LLALQRALIATDQSQSSSPRRITGSRLHRAENRTPESVNSRIFPAEPGDLPLD